MKKRALDIMNAIRIFFKKILSVTEVRYALYAVLTVILAEILATGSILRPFCYMAQEPLAFIAAASFVYVTYMLTTLIPGRIGAMIIIVCIWLGLMIANCVLLSFRVNPLSAVDFSIIFSVISIINVYLSTFQIILICALILGAVALGIFAMIKLPSRKPKYKRAAIGIVSSALFCAAAVFLSVEVNSSDMRNMNMPSAYDKYGFIYCFSMSTVDRGIDKPDEYSKGGIIEIIEPLDSNHDDPEKEESDGPNIVIVQLESFFDPTQIKGLETNKDAIPYFRSLKENYPSGLLEVPVSGAGTVNTEFEVLCGIPLLGFGLGEYPYETVLESSPCESIAYYLGNEGYTCHSIHNHTGTFYNRHIVMENLGFDTFTPVEYMNEVERNTLGWAEDSVLTGEILGVMDSTKGADFVYAISVQPHGKYYTAEGNHGDIKVTDSAGYDEDKLDAYEFYLNELSDSDATVAQIVSELSRRDEDTVAVFFGDHLPALDLSDGDIESGSIYKTEYVIWSNFEIEADDCDLEAYRLTSHLLDAVGIKGGIISEYHSKYYGSDSYTENLRDLSYDLIFGQKYAYGGSFPYKTPSMTFGWRPFSAEEATIKYETLYVMGEGFTECSKVYINGRKADTVYISDKLIVCPNISSADTVEVGQTANNGKILGVKVKARIIN